VGALDSVGPLDPVDPVDPEFGFWLVVGPELVPELGEEGVGSVGELFILKNDHFQVVIGMPVDF